MKLLTLIICAFNNSIDSNCNHWEMLEFITCWISVFLNVVGRQHLVMSYKCYVDRCVTWYRFVIGKILQVVGHVMQVCMFHTHRCSRYVTCRSTIQQSQVFKPTFCGQENPLAQSLLNAWSSWNWSLMMIHWAFPSGLMSSLSIAFSIEKNQVKNFKLSFSSRSLLNSVIFFNLVCCDLV